MKPKKIVPRPPIKDKTNLLGTIKLILMTISFIILWIIIFAAALNVLAYYIFLVATKGVFNPDTITYAVIVAVGSYFCLIVDKDKIYIALGINRDIPYIDPKKSNKVSGHEKNNF